MPALCLLALLVAWLTAQPCPPIVPGAGLHRVDASVVTVCCSLLTNQSGLQPDKSRSGCNIYSNKLAEAKRQLAVLKLMVPLLCLQHTRPQVRHTARPVQVVI